MDRLHAAHMVVNAWQPRMRPLATHHAHTSQRKPAIAGTPQAVHGALPTAAHVDVYARSHTTCKGMPSAYSAHHAPCPSLTLLAPSPRLADEHLHVRLKRLLRWAHLHTWVEQQGRAASVPESTHLTELHAAELRPPQAAQQGLCPRTMTNSASRPRIMPGRGRSLSISRGRKRYGGSRA